MPGSLQGDWVHGAQPATSEVPVSQGKEHWCCRQGLLTQSASLQGLAGTWHLGQPPKVLGVEGVMNQRQQTCLPAWKMPQEQNLH